MICGYRTGPTVKARSTLELNAADWKVVSQSALQLRWLSDGMVRAFAPGGPQGGQPFVALSQNSISKMRLSWENATRRATCWRRWPRTSAWLGYRTRSSHPTSQSGMTLPRVSPTGQEGGAATRLEVLRDHEHDGEDHAEELRAP